MNRKAPEAADIEHATLVNSTLGALGDSFSNYVELALKHRIVKNPSTPANENLSDYRF